MNTLTDSPTYLSTYGMTEEEFDAVMAEMHAAKQAEPEERAARTAQENKVCAKTPYGRVLLLLRAAQKASASAKAKVANKMSFRDYMEANDSDDFAAGHYNRSLDCMRRAYREKNRCLSEATNLCLQHSCLAFGWGKDEAGGWVVYFDLPGGQASFHSPERGDGPDYPFEWDGLANITAARIEEAIACHVSNGFVPPVSAAAVCALDQAAAAAERRRAEEALDAHFRRLEEKRRRVQQLIAARMAGLVWRCEHFTLAYCARSTVATPLVLVKNTQRPHARSLADWKQMQAEQRLAIKTARRVKKLQALGFVFQIYWGSEGKPVNPYEFTLGGRWFEVSAASTNKYGHRVAASIRRRDCNSHLVTRSASRSQGYNAAWTGFRQFLALAREIRRDVDLWKHEEARDADNSRSQAALKVLLTARPLQTNADTRREAAHYGIPGRSKLSIAELDALLKPLRATEFGYTVFNPCI